MFPFFRVVLGFPACTGAFLVDFWFGIRGSENDELSLFIIPVQTRCLSVGVSKGSQEFSIRIELGSMSPRSNVSTACSIKCLPNRNPMSLSLTSTSNSTRQPEWETFSMVSAWYGQARLVSSRADTGFVASVDGLPYCFPRMV